ncbi:uncharacterized protein TNCV_4088761 [Trichonephila clavipes]|nr:uncharacterized protein TNCV_4088761 [Trichonephila clavipes]
MDSFRHRFPTESGEFAGSKSGFRRLRGFPSSFRGRHLIRAPSRNQFLRRRSFTTALSKKISYCCEGLTPAPSKTQSFIVTRGFNTAPSKTPIPPLTLSVPLYPLPSHLIFPHYPLMFCPFSAPIGLGSFELLSLSRSHRFRCIPALAPCAPMSGYTLCVSRRAVVTRSGVNKTHC